MKLLICTQIIDKNDPILGFFHRWVEEFAKHFDHIYVMCLKEGIHTLPSNVTVFSLGKEGGESRIKYVVRFYKFFSKIFLIKKVDFVFFHMGAVYNILAFPFFCIRKLLHTQFFWWKTHGKINHLKERISFRICDAVYTAGSKSFTVMTDKVHVVGHAIDTEMYTYTTRASEHEIPKCISVGRVTPIKKIDIALRAITIYTKNFSQKVTLDIFGPDTDVVCKTELESFIQGNALGAQVTFCGGRTASQMSTLYAEYDILIHPAYEAGFDKVVLEAMATGVIPITSIPSFETILSPFGLYVPQEDVEGYTRVMHRIAEMDGVERHELRKKLRAIVVANHSITTLPKRIFTVL